MKHFIHLYLITAFSILNSGFARAQSLDISVRWHVPVVDPYADSKPVTILNCEGAATDEQGLPLIIRNFPLAAGTDSVKASLNSAVFAPLSTAEIAACHNVSLPADITLQYNLGWNRKGPLALLRFVPLRKNAQTGEPEKLISCTINFSTSHGNLLKSSATRGYASHSVLASGNWYKIGITASGICRITASDLSAMGLNPASINPRNIRIYGNGGGMLPENNSASRHDDLAENAIEVVGEADGSFDAGDYILFYAKGPLGWRYSAANKRFEHVTNPYADMACYFITADLGPGRRIPLETGSGLEATDVVSQFDDYALHEKDEFNLIKSGRQWFGDFFDIQTNYNFNFSFPGLVTGSDVNLRSRVIARSIMSSSFTYTVTGNTWSVPMDRISTVANNPYATASSNVRTIAAEGSSVDINIRYNKSQSEATGWLDYLEVNVRRSLTFQGGQMLFRDTRSAVPGHIAQYILGSVSNNVNVWDVTDPINAAKVATTFSGNNITFRLASDSIREFAAFDGTSYVPVQFISKINNQDLHAMRGYNMLIISPAVFADQAYRLATYHANVDGLRTLVVDPELIYNEFSSGVQDISGIRDFIKMLYDVGSGNDTLSYVLLFGDGSYDNKNRIADNSNFIPTYQSEESLHPVNSYVTDDFYTYLDNGEGNGAYDVADIGLGRLPVKTADEARQAVDKILHYDTHTPELMGDWRNVICFVADDEDGNDHVVQAEQLATQINNIQNCYNIDKIYLDAYPQVSTPGGQRYPEVNKAINERVAKGALIVNYTGHGGEVGLALERVVEVSDINSWRNYDKMPVFLTATCEFSRFDDPGRTSAGELVFLNPLGGGIALFTTTRPTYGTPNFAMNSTFYKYAFSTNKNGEHLRMGDILLNTKRESGSNPNGKKFILFGDPALRMAYPQLKVETTSVNERAVDDGADTLRALSHVLVKGKITDAGGQTVTGFNGTVIPTIFDKPLNLLTLANDGGSKFAFNLQKNILYKGQVEVKNGLFSFNFIVPRDIAYQYGFGRISYYAFDSDRDAAGAYRNVVVGGFDENIQMDEQGPTVSLFMNDDRFVSGGITDENPLLFARIYDENGINTLGNGIGHDIVAVLDNASDEPYILNDYYQAETNTFSSGRLSFPFYNLAPGLHTLSLKVWDVFNNSSETLTEFIVNPSSSFTIDAVSNYPNPFTDQTYFTFEHNQPGQPMDVKISIYNLEGQHMAIVQSTVIAGGYKSEPIKWNGNSDGGSPLSAGMYIYRITATTADGRKQYGTGKLAITR
ncbi:MAG TPA: type IX secretion system sortase PorU [Bacteroidales bacterium]